MTSWRTHKDQAGDTIVEVLIAAAIVSSVLIGAFSVATRSTNAVRDSQEHSEMAQLLQGQVEGVRKLALAETSDSTGVFSVSSSASPKHFCIDSGGNKADQTLSNLPALDVDNFSGYEPCNKLQGLYNITITYSDSTKVFTFTGRWDRIGGNKNEEQMSYRIHPGSVPAAIGAGFSIPPPSGLASCADVQALPGLTKYYDLRNYAGTDWNVYYYPTDKSLATIPLTVSMPPGKYHVWSGAKDNSYKLGAKNRRLHYNGYNSDGSVSFITPDTTEIPSVKNVGDPAQPQAINRTDVKLTQPATYLLVQHSPIDPTSTDDSVDSACFAYQKY